MPQLRSRHPGTLASGRSRAARRLALFLLSGLALAAVPAAAVRAQDLRPPVQSAVDPFAAHIAEAARRFAIPEHWIRAVLRVESAGNVTAISSAGAQGLMQVMPETWAALRVRHRLGDDPFDPRDNILAGTAYLREMLDRYGNIGAMLAAYNAGPGRYDEFLSTGRILPAETRAYVAVLAPLLGGDSHVAGASDAPPPPADWREASLFIGPSGQAAAVPPLPDGRPGNGTPPDAAGQGTPFSPPASGGLFVARSGVGEAP